MTTMTTSSPIVAPIVQVPPQPQTDNSVTRPFSITSVSY